MPLPKKGLRVKWCENIATYEPPTKGRPASQITQLHKNGWFIQVWHCGKWRALMQLRFAREKDAVMAATALARGGLDSSTAMKRVEPMLVLQVACEALSW